MKYCMSVVAVCIVAMTSASASFAAPQAASNQQPTPRISAQLPPPPTVPVSRRLYPVTQRSVAELGSSAGQRPLISVSPGLARLLAFNSNIVAVFFSDETVVQARAINARTIALTGIAAGQATVAVFTQRDPKDVTGVARVFHIAVQPAQNAVSPEAIAEITEISLERTACFGACPMDKVTLRADGTATYEGRRFVERLGQFKGTVRQIHFQHLAELLQSHGFFSLKDRYDAPVTDKPSIITSVVSRGKRKMITNYGDYGPIQLWGLERAILGVAAEIKWQKVEQPAAATENKSGIRGGAMAGPISPVVREGDPPNERPLARAVITIQHDGGGKEIVRKRADEKGRFEIALPPGTYLLVPLGPQASDEAPREEPEADPNLKGDAAMLPRGAPQTVVVEEGKFTEVTVDYDTGIR